MKILVLLLHALVQATIYPPKPGSQIRDTSDQYVKVPPLVNPKKTGKLKTGTVHDKQLVTVDQSIGSVLEHHAQIGSKKRIKMGSRKRTNDGDVLAYVTPWNNHGYDIAKLEKFTLVAPVWFQMGPQKRDGKIQLVVNGQHDVDQGWIGEVRQTGARIVPRIIFEKFHPSQLTKMLKQETLLKQIAKTLVDLTVKHKLDGLVIELWSSLKSESTRDAIHLMTHIADALHAKDKLVILVIPPKRNHGQGASFDAAHFDQLYQVVDYFSLMTYDSDNEHGFNAPLKWVAECIEHIDPGEKARMKILMGLNFYGRHINMESNQAEHILGRDLVAKLAKLDPSLTFDWSAEAHEHYLPYSDENEQRAMIFYPSLMSIATRLDLAAKLKVGISIWEIGQGLDYFYDLF